MIKNVPFERRFLHQMSSGVGTQHNDSRGELEKILLFVKNNKIRLLGLIFIITTLTNY